MAVAKEEELGEGVEHQIPLPFSRFCVAPCLVNQIDAIKGGRRRRRVENTLFASSLKKFRFEKVFY